MSAETYLATHNLEPLFKEMLAALIHHRPQEPLQLLIDALIHIQSNLQSELPFAYAEVFQQCVEQGRRDSSGYESASPALLAQRRNSLQVPQPVFSGRRRMSLPYAPASPRKYFGIDPTFESEPESDEFDVNDYIGARQPSPFQRRSSISGYESPSLLPRPLSPRFTDVGIAMATSRGRRGSVSAESITPSISDETEYPAVVIPKDKEALMRIASAISNNLLFKNLEKDQRMQVVDAMFERRVVAGEEVIAQGDEGDNFYVVDDGLFQVEIDGKKIVEVGPGGSFGELALMYNTPRAATIYAMTDGLLWAVDRVTFHRTVTNNTFRKRKQYEQWLQTVPILQSLETQEVAKIADALEPIEFEEGEEIVVQGYCGDYFYIIEEGQAIVTQEDEEGEEYELSALSTGDYFGEMSLLTNEPRAATVTAVEKCRLVALSKDAFVRLLGPISDVLLRNMENYSHAQKRRKAAFIDID